MRQFTIAERLVAAALLPLAAMLAVPHLAAALAPLLGAANAVYAEICHRARRSPALAGAVVLVIVRSIARPLAEAVDTHRRHCLCGT